MTSRAFTCLLDPEMADTYLRLHADPLGGVREAIWCANIRNLEIFRHAPTNQLFARYDHIGANLDADLARLAEHNSGAQWRELTDGCLRPVSSDAGNWEDMEQIFASVPPPSDAGPMPIRPLGRTGLELTEFGFGAAGLVKRNHADAMATMQAAWAGGIRYIDTAPHYGRGLSERLVGDFLRNRPRADYVLSTKVGRVMEPAPDEAPMPFTSRYDYSGEGIRRSLEHSLLRLGLGSIDIALIHDIGTFTHGEENARHMRDLRESGSPALADLRSEGTLKAIGVGVNECQAAIDLIRDGDIDCVLIAGRHTLLDRTAEVELLPLAAERGVGIIGAGVFNSGVLLPDGPKTFDYRPASSDIVARADAIREALSEMSVPLERAALNFPLTDPRVASVLLGTSDPLSTAAACRACGALLPTERLPSLDTLALR